MFHFSEKLMIALMFAWGQADAAVFLTSNQIIELIAGHSSSFYGHYGRIQFTGESQWSKNGTISGFTNYLNKKRIWHGTWYVKNNQYCRTLTGYGKTDSKCLRVEKINANTIRFIKLNGDVSSTSHLK